MKGFFEETLREKMAERTVPNSQHQTRLTKNEIVGMRGIISSIMDIALESIIGLSSNMLSASAKVSGAMKLT